MYLVGYRQRYVLKPAARAKAEALGWGVWHSDMRFRSIHGWIRGRYRMGGGVAAIKVSRDLDSGQVAYLSSSERVSRG